MSDILNDEIEHMVINISYIAANILRIAQKGGKPPNREMAFLKKASSDLDESINLMEAPQETAEVEIKNPPGISAVKVKNREILREINSCEDSDQLIAFLYSEGDHFKKVCHQYPGEWIGENDSGLRNELAKFAARNDFPDRIETARLIAKWIINMEDHP